MVLVSLISFLEVSSPMSPTVVVEVELALPFEYLAIGLLPRAEYY
jgi:hypothetical protein